VLKVVKCFLFIRTITDSVHAMRNRGGGK